MEGYRYHLGNLSVSTEDFYKAKTIWKDFTERNKRNPTLVEDLDLEPIRIRLKQYQLFGGNYLTQTTLRTRITGKSLRRGFVSEYTSNMHNGLDLSRWPG